MYLILPPRRHARMPPNQPGSRQSLSVPPRSHPFFSALDHRSGTPRGFTWVVIGGLPQAAHASHSCVFFSAIGSKISVSTHQEPGRNERRVQENRTNAFDEDFQSSLERQDLSRYFRQPVWRALRRAD